MSSFFKFDFNLSILNLWWKFQTQASKTLTFLSYLKAKDFNNSADHKITKQKQSKFSTKKEIKLIDSFALKAKSYIGIDCFFIF